MEEIIKPIEVYHNNVKIKKGYYGVSNLGRVWSYNKQDWLFEMNEHSYHWVGLKDEDGNTKTCFVHRLVLEAAAAVGAAPCSILQAASGRLKTCKNYKWKDLTKEE